MLWRIPRWLLGKLLESPKCDFCRNPAKYSDGVGLLACDDHAYLFDSDERDRKMTENGDQIYRDYIKYKRALRQIRGWREIGNADTPSEKLREIEKICDTALGQ